MNQHIPHWNMEDNSSKDYGDILPILATDDDEQKNDLDEQQQGDIAALFWQNEQYAVLQEQTEAAAALQEDRELLLGGTSVDSIPQEGGGETSSWYENTFDKGFCAEFFSDVPSAGACSAEAPDIPVINIDTDHDVGGVVAEAELALAVNYELGSDQIQEHVVANSSLGDGVAGRRKEIDDGLSSAAAAAVALETTFASSSGAGGGGEQCECSRGQKRKERDAVDVGEGKQDSHEGKRLAIRIRASEVHNLSERRRRDRINEKMKALQDLIPHSNKTDKASMLDEAIEYLKALQLQVQLMWMGSTGMAHMMCPGAQLLQYDASRMGMGMAHQHYHHLHHPHHAVQLMQQNGAASAAAAAAAAAAGVASPSHGNLFFHPPAGMKPVDPQSLQMERPPCFGYHHLPPPHPQMMNLCAFGHQMLNQCQLAAAVPPSITLPTAPCDKNSHESKPSKTNF